MKKSMLILLICTALTACGNYETETAVTENVATETVTQLQTEAVTQVTTQTATTEITTKPVVTTTITTTLPETTSTTPTTTEAFIAEKKNEIKARVTTAKVKYAEAVKMTTTTEVSETVTTTTATTTSTTATAPPETTITTTTTEVIQTEPLQNNQTDYEKALAVYEYMTANGSGTCVQYAYATYEMCQEYGLECYFIWTESKLYGHVANVVKVDGVWYVLDTQGRCFLTENMCGFTEIVDENESYIATADIISGIRYE